MAIAPYFLSDWVPRPFALNVKKCGVNAEFSEDDTVVKRKKPFVRHGGCVVYTANPLPLDQVWQTTILRTTKKWDGIIPMDGRKWWNSGLVSG